MRIFLIIIKTYIPSLFILYCIDFYILLLVCIEKRESYYSKIKVGNLSLPPHVTGYGLCCTARTNMGTMYCAEAMSNHQGEELEARLPEDVGREAAWRLMEEIFRGGCTDTLGQPLVLLFMALAPKDISKFVCGPLTPYT